MVFVNDLAGVANIPAWMKHVPPNVDGMTFVDVVFPAFLFIVGMAIPFAVRHRLAKDSDPVRFWQHALIRTLGLLILGVYMVNSAEMNSTASLIPKSIWTPAFYIAAILIWNNYPKSITENQQVRFRTLQGLGIATLIILFATYRKTMNGTVVGMTPSWWGILGLIGWAYLIALIVFWLAKENLLAIGGSLIALSLILVLLWSDLPLVNTHLSWFKQEAKHIAHAIIVLSGIVCSLILTLGGMRQKPIQKIRNMLLLGLLMAVTGYFVRPFGGISKNLATPAWTLYSAAICMVVFPVIYWLVDVKSIKSWANFLRPAGENPLLTYLLPPLFYSIVGFSYLPRYFNSGLPGFMRAVVFSVLILWLARWLTAKGVRMKL